MGATGAFTGPTWSKALARPWGGPSRLVRTSSALHPGEISANVGKFFPVNGKAGRAHQIFWFFEKQPDTLRPPRRQPPFSLLCAAWRTHNTGTGQAVAEHTNR